jgi:hypothetical protein
MGEKERGRKENLKSEILNPQYKRLHYGAAFFFK